MTKLPATIGPLLINETNLSIAWAKILIHILDRTGTEVSPLILSLTGFDEHGRPQEIPEIREKLDNLLLNKSTSRKKLISVEDVAFTIFPQRLWKIAQGDRSKLFRYYLDAFPRYQAINRKHNYRGLYFERLIDYKRGPENGNQLEWLISQFNSREGIRRSMFQASIFDPARDHNATALIEFPCLQHVSFEPTDEGLVINAFYATQQIFNKAYGNYLGVAQLGAFMAHEMHMKLIRMNVIIGVAKLNGIPKTDPDLVKMADGFRKYLSIEITSEENASIVKKKSEIAS